MQLRNGRWNPVRAPRGAHQENGPFLFQIHTIRLVNATFLIAKRKSMNWTGEVNKT